MLKRVIQHFPDYEPSHSKKNEIERNVKKQGKKLADTFFYLSSWIHVNRRWSPSSFPLLPSHAACLAIEIRESCLIKDYLSGGFSTSSSGLSKKKRVRDQVMSL